MHHISVTYHKQTRMWSHCILSQSEMSNGSCDTLGVLSEQEKSNRMNLWQKKSSENDSCRFVGLQIGKTSDFIRDSINGLSLTFLFTQNARKCPTECLYVLTQA